MVKNTPILLHNPRCSKSRQTLSLLRENNIDFEIREYLKAPLDNDEVRALIAKLNGPANQLVRAREARDAGLQVAVTALSPSEVASWLVDHPESMQRPVVYTSEAARIGRPPEDVLALFD